MQGGFTKDSWSEYSVPDTTLLLMVLYELSQRVHVDLPTFYDDLALEITVPQCHHEHAYVRTEDTYLPRRVHDHGLERTLTS